MNKIYTSIKEIYSRILQIIKPRLTKIVKYITSPDFYNFVTLQLQIKPMLKNVPFWISALIVGVLATLYSELFASCITFSQWILRVHPYLLFVLSPIFMVLSVYVVDRIAVKAGGIGIPTVLESLELSWKKDKVSINERLDFKVAVAIILSSLLMALAGGALGREGPMVHLAACIFFIVGRALSSYFPFLEHRSSVIAGGAAGLAATFNAPLAGVVFVLEELAKKEFHQFKSAIITAAIIAGITTQWLSGKYLFLGYPSMGSVGIESIPYAIVLGIICGMFSFLFYKILVSDLKNNLIKKYFKRKIFFAIFAGLLIASLGLIAGPHVLGGGITLIQSLLFSGETVSWSLLVGRFLSTIITHLTGCTGGFLAPALALGGSLGAKFAELTNYNNPNLLILVGMAAFLSAIIRAPFTGWIVVMEMTDRHSAIFPLMIASLIGNQTLRFLEERKEILNSIKNNINKPNNLT